MASLAKPVDVSSESDRQAEVDRLTDEVFSLFDRELATMDSAKEAAIIADVHATAESLRAKS